MSYEAALVAALSPLVGGRVYPDEAATQQDGAYILWQQVGGEAVNALDGALPGLRHARVQVDCWSGTRKASSDLARAAEAALLAAYPAALPQPPYVYGAFVSRYERDLRLYGTTQDFGIWYE